jgi:hypothetical protein
VNSTIFNNIRSACRQVAERASFISINRDRLKRYALSLPLLGAGSPQLDPKCHYLGRGEKTAAFLVTLDSINFGSGYFPHIRKREGMSGYFTVATSLHEYFQRQGPLSASALSDISIKDCEYIFGQDLRIEPVRDLMGLFARALNDLGRYLLDRFDGSFVTLIKDAGFSAEQLILILSEMPFFKDVETYGYLDVPFFKRAQITAADLSVAFGGKGLGRFDDLRSLTMFADNLVPHVLRVDGMLRYSDDLAERIDRAELIPAGSREEVEIRACAVHTVELLREALESAGREVSSMGLDYILWNRGQEPSYKKAKPRHRTRTVFY